MCTACFCKSALSWHKCAHEPVPTTTRAPVHGSLGRHPTFLRWLGLSLLWLVVAVPASLLIFTQGSRDTVLASHDAVVRATFDGYATLGLGPYLPDFRYPTGGPVGAHIDLGKTTADSYQELIQRYAFIASQPEGQVAKLRSTVTDMALDSALTGGLLALSVPGLWLLLGRRRRTDLVRQVTVRRTTVAALVVGLGAVALTQPWVRPERQVEQATTWEPVTEALPDVPMPAEARRIEVESGLMTSGTRRLAESAFDTYRRSVRFYQDLAVAAGELAGLHQPGADEVVGLLVSDRHDNIGMDPVARAIGDRGGATFLLDAGDDTSTGQPWEAFSLESLDHAFEDYDERYAIAGNHDNGDFVSEYDAKLGLTTLRGEVVDGPDGMRLLGVNDPRSSGLGTWRDERGISFAEQEQRLADLACRHDQDGDRVTTLLVHDADSGARRSPADAWTWCWPATRTSRSVPPRSSARSTRPVTPTRTGRPAGRRTPWPSALSCAATRR